MHGYRYYFYNMPLNDKLINWNVQNLNKVRVVVAMHVWNFAGGVT